MKVITVPELSPQETAIFSSFMSPKFPARVRSLYGIMKSTGLSETEIRQLLAKPRHSRYLLRGEQDGREVFHLRMHDFLARNPTFHQHCLN